MIGDAIGECCTYAKLTGENPFAATSGALVLYHHMAKEIHRELLQLYKQGELANQPVWLGELVKEMKRIFGNAGWDLRFYKEGKKCSLHFDTKPYENRLLSSRSLGSTQSKHFLTLRLMRTKRNGDNTYGGTYTLDGYLRKLQTGGAGKSVVMTALGGGTSCIGGYKGRLIPAYLPKEALGALSTESSPDAVLKHQTIETKDDIKMTLVVDIENFDRNKLTESVRMEKESTSDMDQRIQLDGLSNEFLRKQFGLESKMASTTNQELWDSNFSLLEKFKAEKGHCNVPRKHQEDGKTLGTWLDRQRQSKRKGTLDSYLEAKLQDLGVKFSSYHKDKFDTKAKFEAKLEALPWDVCQSKKSMSTAIGMSVYGFNKLVEKYGVDINALEKHQVSDDHEDHNPFCEEDNLPSEMDDDEAPKAAVGNVKATGETSKALQEGAYVVEGNQSKYVQVQVPAGELGVSLTNQDDGSGTFIDSISSGPLSFALKPGDKLVAVDGTSVVGMTYSQVKSLIASRAQWERRFTVKRTGGMNLDGL